MVELEYFLHLFFLRASSESPKTKASEEKKSQYVAFISI